MIPRRKYDIEDNLHGIIASSLIGNNFVDGEEIAEFENRFALTLSQKSKNEVYATSTASGRDALQRLLTGLKIPNQLKILIPSYTLGALVPFLNQKGFKCKVCDIEKDYPVFSAETLEKELNDDISCILLTHLFGYVSEIEDIISLAKSRNIMVIEDCAHSIGSGYYEYSPGTFGDGALFSFDSLKPVNAFGGGMAVTRHQAIAQKISEQERNEPLPNHLQVLQNISMAVTEQFVLKTPLLKLPTGLLAFEQTRPIMDALDSKLRRPTGKNKKYKRFSNVQALLGLKQLKSLDSRVERKRYIAGKILDTLDIYDEQINGNSYKQSNSYFLVVKAHAKENASNLRKELWLDGIDAGFGSEIADDLGVVLNKQFPNSSDWFNRAIQLPCYSSMDDNTLDELLNKLQKYKGRLVKD